ncbi:MAG: hypothetical protein R3B90_06280 [Planctomycetaceae bacterium]
MKPRSAAIHTPQPGDSVEEVAALLAVARRGETDTQLDLRARHADAVPGGFFVTACTAVLAHQLSLPLGRQFTANACWREARK